MPKYAIETDTMPNIATRDEEFILHSKPVHTSNTEKLAIN